MGILDGSQTAEEGIANLLRSLGSLLINSAFQTLFSPASAGGAGWGVGSGGKGLFGGAIIPGILHSGGVAGVDGYGHGRSFDASTWAGAQRYHNGGIAGLKANEVPAILERGEIIIPKGDANNNQPVNITVTVVGARGNAEIQQMVASGVSQGMKAYDKQLPGRISEIQMRQ